MPGLDELGTEYTSFPIYFGADSGGYEIRIIAVENNTDVSVPAFSADFSLNTGDYYVVDNQVTRYGFKVLCSKPCMVVQYVRSLPAGGSTDAPMGTFMAALTPDEGASNNLIFTVPHIMLEPSADAAMSIIMNTFPVTGLHLNDTSLANLTWQLVENTTSCYATFAIDLGFYHLYSNEPSEKWVQTAAN